MIRIIRQDVPMKTGGASPGAEKTAPQAKSAQTPVVSSGPETMSTRLGLVFSRHGIEVPQSLLVSIGSELAALGIVPGDLDGTAALQALLLASHNIPLDGALLFPDAGQSQSVLTEIAALFAEAKSFLATGQLTGESRAVLEQFVRNISTLFRFDAAADPSGADAAQISAALQKSGLSFEWRLLAWYRAGHDPMMLRTLVEDDLKGILLGFLERLRRKGVWKNAAGKRLEKLERGVESALKAMTNRQLANILDPHTVRRGFGFELPFGEGPGRGQAGIVVKGSDEKKADDGITGDEFTLSFAVETTNLGTVTAFMTVAGKAVTLRFELDDGTAVSLGEEMGDEIRDGLREHGFAVGDVSFARRVETTKSSGKHFNPPENLDIRG